jgi:hypothetical protein
MIWLYPAFSLRGLRWYWRVAWLVFGLTTFVLGVQASQRIEAAPTIRFDGASVKQYMDYIGRWSYRASTRKYYKELFSPTTSWTHDVIWGVILLGYGTVGLFGVANLALAAVAAGRKVLRRPVNVDLETALFPILVVACYLTTALGMAFDEKTPRHSEELRHRPLVWAYFASAAFAGALLYRLFLEERVQRSPRWRKALLATLFALMIIPLRYGPNAQVSDLWCWTYAWKTYPRGWFECARYIRENASRGDVVQDSEFDPWFVFAAECEHPAYAIAYFDGKDDPVLSERIEELRRFQALTDDRQIRETAYKLRIRWYVLGPESRVNWPASLLEKPAFSWNEHRVYSFQSPGERLMGVTSIPEAGPGGDPSTAADSGSTGLAGLNVKASRR